jgi:hypothetical protein
LELVQWIYGLGGVIIRLSFYRRKSLEVAKWIYSFGEVNVHVCHDQAFQSACLNGNLGMAQWLYYEVGNLQINQM